MEDRSQLLKEYKTIHRQFTIAALIALSLLVGGAIFYHFVEDLGWLDAFYFCTITLTTIGYGDISPHTSIGKLFTIFYVIVGVGILATFANLLIKNATVKRMVKKNQK